MDPVFQDNPLIAASRSFRDFGDAPAPERDWLVEGLIPAGAVTFLSGDGGAGKSHLALQLMMAAALGLPWLGRKTKAVRSVGLFCEDDEGELERRAKAIARHCGVRLSDARLAGANFIARLHHDNRLVDYYALYDRAPFNARREVYRPTDLHAQLIDWAKWAEAKLVVLDSLHDFFFENENSRPVARAFVGELRAIAQEIGGAVLVLAHPSLNGMQLGTGSSGSTAWNNAVRSRLYLTKALPAPGSSAGSASGAPPDDSRRVLRTVKSNYARVGEVARLRFLDGAFIEDLPASETEAAAERHRAGFMAALALATAQGRAVSEAATASNYAPRVLRHYPSCRGITARQLALAMERLFADGMLARRVLAAKGDRHKVMTLVPFDPALIGDGEGAEEGDPVAVGPPDAAGCGSVPTPAGAFMASD